MEKELIIQALKDIRKDQAKRNFKQSVDLIINLQSLDLKKPEHQVEFFVNLQNGKGKLNKICALVGPELKDEAAKVFDKTIEADQFDKYAADKKAQKKLSEEFDFFVAQANIMAKVASAFGRVLGPRGKMPNPKAGCVVPPKLQLKPVYDKLQKTIRVKAKTSLAIQVPIGSEDMDDSKLLDNYFNIYNTLVNALPLHENNIKSVFMKLTMGHSYRIL
ncbi:50S ribosomal protein L1 [Candidatus Woesearchaeota archaeon]|nr:50S ribosomal protein L1 [Candidatus Woesearchaeota archaeon]